MIVKITVRLFLPIQDSETTFYEPISSRSASVGEAGTETSIVVIDHSVSTWRTTSVDGTRNDRVLVICAATAAEGEALIVMVLMGICVSTSVTSLVNTVLDNGCAVAAASTRTGLGSPTLQWNGATQLREETCSHKQKGHHVYHVV